MTWLASVRLKTFRLDNFYFCNKRYFILIRNFMVSFFLFVWSSDWHFHFSVVKINRNFSIVAFSWTDVKSALAAGVATVAEHILKKSNYFLEHWHFKESKILRLIWILCINLCEASTFPIRIFQKSLKNSNAICFSKYACVAYFSKYV